MVARCGGIRAAARMLDMGQSAVTKALRELEEDIGVPLVLRTSRGISLTPYGHQLVERGNHIVEQMRQVHIELNQMRDGTGGKVVVGVTTTIVETILPDVFNEFRKHMPNVALHFTEAMIPGILPKLRDGGVDFAITSTVWTDITPLSNAFEVKLLRELETVVVCRPGHPKASSQSISELINQEWVLPYFPDSADGLAIDLFNRNGFPVPGRVTVCESTHTAISLVANTNMLTLFNRTLVEQDNIGRYLTIIPAKESLPFSPCCLIRRLDTPPSVAAALLFQLFEEHAAASIKR